MPETDPQPDRDRVTHPPDEPGMADAGTSPDTEEEGDTGPPPDDLARFTPAGVVKTMQTAYIGLIAGLIVFGTFIGFLIVSIGATGGLIATPNRVIGLVSAGFVLAAFVIAPIIRAKAWGTLVGNAHVPEAVQLKAYANGVVLYSMVIAASGLFGCFAAVLDGMVFLVLPIVAIIGLLIGWPKRRHFQGPLDNPYRTATTPATNPYRKAAPDAIRSDRGSRDAAATASPPESDVSSDAPGRPRG